MNWFGRLWRSLRGGGARPPTYPGLADIYLGLRSGILNERAARASAAEGRVGKVWAVMTEMAINDIPMTLLTVIDGTTSLYFGNGGGRLGLGNIGQIQQAAEDFLSQAQFDVAHATPVSHADLPAAGMMQFYFLTPSALLKAEGPLNAIQEGWHRLAVLGAKANDVLTAYRLAEDRGEIAAN